MKDLLRFVQTLEVEEITHVVGTEDSSTFLSITTNYGSAIYDTDKTDTNDLKYRITGFDYSDVNIDAIIENSGILDSIKHFIWDEIKKSIEKSTIIENNMDWD